MKPLSPTMEAALCLASEQGVLVRRPGGYWTPPGEPLDDEGTPVGWPDRSVGTRTIYALRDRGRLSGKAWNDPAAPIEPAPPEPTAPLQQEKT